MTKRDSDCKTPGSLLCRPMRSVLASYCRVTSHHRLSSLHLPCLLGRSVDTVWLGPLLRVSLGLARAEFLPEA